MVPLFLYLVSKLPSPFNVCVVANGHTAPSHSHPCPEPCVLNPGFLLSAVVIPHGAQNPVVSVSWSHAFAYFALSSGRLKYQGIKPISPPPAENFPFWSPTSKKEALSFHK